MSDDICAGHIGFKCLRSRRFGTHTKEGHDMKKTRSFRSLGLLATVLGISAIFLACSQPANPDLELDSSNPTVVSTIAADNATGVAINKTISATFDESMDSSTIVADNFTVFSPTEAVVGSVTYDKPNKRAIFAPSANLAADTLYTATVKTGTLDLAGNYAILAKSAISTVPSSDITGDVGLSPAAESYMTGFSQTDATGYATSPQVTGFLYAADMTPPTPTYMTTAISDMELAYTDAAGRILPDYLELGTGAIGGLTLVPGLYKWTNSVTMASDVAISGDANDVWILQIDGNLSSSSATRITLSGGAQASNIFWQVAGEVTLGTTSHFEGIILSKTAVTMNTGATMNGRILAQTNVALDQATVTEPAF